MNRRGFLLLVIPVVATACMDLGNGFSNPHPTQGSEYLRSFMQRNRDRRRDAAKKRRERRARDRRRDAAKKRRERRARARRRRRNRGF